MGCCSSMCPAHLMFFSKSAPLSLHASTSCRRADRSAACLRTSDTSSSKVLRLPASAAI